MNIFRSSHLQMFFKIGALKKFAVFLTKESLQHRCFPANIAKFWRTGFLQNFSVGCFCIILKVIKQLFCKGFFKEISLLWCPNNFYSRHISERRIVWCIKKKTCLFTNLSLISRFSKQLHQGVLYKAETWHALSQEQYFSKHHFLDICQCAFNLELAKNMIKPPLIWLIYLMYNFISCQWVDIITI